MRTFPKQKRIVKRRVDIFVDKREAERGGIKSCACLPTPVGCLESEQGRLVQTLANLLLRAADVRFLLSNGKSD